eukprot:COSAG06_NODE_1784_length_8405_cov_15.271129_4_plen_138_part_00
MLIALSQNFSFPRTNIRDCLTRCVGHFELQRKELRPAEDTHRSVVIPTWVTRPRDLAASVRVQATGRLPIAIHCLLPICSPDLILARWPWKWFSRLNCNYNVAGIRVLTGSVIRTVFQPTNVRLTKNSRTPALASWS